MSDKYFLLMYYVHSYLETVRHELVVTSDTTVENFRDKAKNDEHCLRICDHSRSQWNYELSNNQVCNGINLFLKCWNMSNLKPTDK